MINLRITRLMAGFILFLFASPQNLQAQEEKAAQEELPVYAVVNYMKIKPGQDPIALEQEVYEPIHQEAANRGHRLGWDLIGVWMPGGSSRKYDYITVDYYRGMPGSQNVPEGEWENMLKKVHPGKTSEEINKKTEAARDLVWQELFVWKDGAEGPDAEEARYYIVHKMKARQKDMGAYEAMESDIAKPMHKVAIEDGNYEAWSFWQLVLPRGSGRDYNYLTVEAYTEVADLNRPWQVEKIFKKAHPGKDLEKELANIFELREDVSTEAWWNIARVRKQEASAKK